VAINNWIKTSEMAMNGRKKYGKMNLTLELDFYQFLRRKAMEEHLPTSTYVKKYLMDNLLKNNTVDDQKN